MDGVSVLVLGLICPSSFSHANAPTRLDSVPARVYTLLLNSSWISVKVTI